MYNTTFSTAYYDVGRTNWFKYERPPELYFDYFKNVSKITSNLVIYCQEKNKKTIEDIVKNRDCVKIITRPFEELDFYKKFFNRAKTLMESDLYKSRVTIPYIPEHIHPEYNIINFNKISFVKESINYFDTEYNGWIDFGFGHNKSYVKYTFDENFSEKVTKGDKVFMRSLKQPTLDKLFNVNSYFDSDVHIQGSCFLGTKKSIIRMYDLMEVCINKALEIGALDEDQTQYMMAYLLDSNNFNLSHGDWFTHFYE
jgi:protein YibB